MLTDVSLIKGLGIVLHKNGFDVYYYDEKEEYTSKLVRDADLILVIPYEAGNKFGNVGKGQYNEIQLAKRLNIPVYFTCLFHHGDISNNIAWLQTTFNPVTTNSVMNDLLLIIDITE